jgi:pyruvate/2-oxoacid:ferredoxin oxidoreductase beta subunit
MPKLTIPAAEVMRPGHAACPGCGAALAMRYLLKGLGEGVVMSLPACCWAVIGGPFPNTALDAALLDTAFEATGASLSGLRAACDALGYKDAQVVGFAGDGGTADIGLQALSGMLERRTDALYVMYDNEAYMNTGVQRSGATPRGAATTTTPAGGASRGKAEPKKDIFAIVLAHRPAYAATANVAFPEDFVRKVQKAKSIEGPRFLHVLAPCPPGWGFAPERTIELGRLATDTNLFPLVEYEGGSLRLTRRPSVRTRVEAYLKLQGRFGHLTAEEVAEFQNDVDLAFEALSARCSPSPPRGRPPPAAPARGSASP